MHRRAAQEALRNAPFCIKYELDVFRRKKSRDRFISVNSFFCGHAHTHTDGANGWARSVVSLRVTWSWLGEHSNQPTNRLTASWGSENGSCHQPATTLLPDPAIHREKGKLRETNNLALLLLCLSRETQQLSVVPSSPHSVWLSGRPRSIAVREQLPIDDYALASLYISLSLSSSDSVPLFLSLSLSLSLLCAFLSLTFWMDVPKKKTDEMIPFALLNLPGCRFNRMTQQHWGVGRMKKAIRHLFPFFCHRTLLNLVFFKNPLGASKNRREHYVVYVCVYVCKVEEWSYCKM